MTYQLSTLENGLRVASEENAADHCAAVAIAVDVGARYEEIRGAVNEGGLSHLLEHMAFKGTATMDAKEIAEAFDMMGGNVNAYTSHEHTVYHAKVLKEYAEEATHLLCDIITNSVFDEAELAREREVILQEIAMHQDSPDDLVFDLYQEMAYGDTPLGRSILGTPERVASFTRDDVVAYTARHYQPARMSLATAGAMSHSQTLAITQHYFGARVNTQAVPITPVACAYRGGEKTLEKELEQVHLAVGFDGVSILDADYFPLQAFATILGGGMSSRLFQEIREKRGLAYSVSAFVTGYQDTGTMGLYAGTTVEHLGELTGALMEVCHQAAASISEAELLRAKNQLKAGIVMSRESCGAIAEWIARHLLVYGRYKTAEELLAQIDAITVADAMRAGARALHCVTPVVAALGPVGSVHQAQLYTKFAA